MNDVGQAPIAECINYHLFPWRVVFVCSVSGRSSPETCRATAAAARGQHHISISHDMEIIKQLTPYKSLITNRVQLYISMCRT